jgi:hypothetical protein
VVLTVGFLPFDVDADPLLYADRVSQTLELALGLIPVHDPDHDRGDGSDYGRNRS